MNIAEMQESLEKWWKEEPILRKVEIGASKEKRVQVVLWDLAISDAESHPTNYGVVFATESDRLDFALRDAAAAAEKLMDEQMRAVSYIAQCEIDLYKEELNGPNSQAG